MSGEGRVPGLTLYGRAACHLCEEAIDLLRRTGLVARWIDVDADLELSLRYGLRLPVLARADGAELDWPFDAAALAAFVPGQDSDSERVRA